jgi:hypothetical protein
MELKEPILKILNKKYDPSSIIEMTFKRYDMTFKTDKEGNPILLFLGKTQNNGSIKGERYARRLKKTETGETIKDHWEHKGKASP